jgi:hypothetical protein
LSSYPREGERRGERRKVEERVGEWRRGEEKRGEEEEEGGECYAQVQCH